MSALPLIIRGVLIPIVWMGSGFAMAVLYDKYKENDKNKMLEKCPVPANQTGNNVMSPNDLNKKNDKC